jgi:hypothetical protein
MIEVPWINAEFITVISQPIFTKIFLHMLKPNPVPFGFKYYPFSSLVKGINKLFASSGLIPIPVSITIKIN